MTDLEPSIPWAQSGWFGRASAWVYAELGRHGIATSGPIEQPHSRPWSTVLRVPTGEGDVYFKAVSPAHPHEPVLLEALARWTPDQAPRLLSVDAERGWVLMRDAYLEPWARYASRADLLEALDLASRLASINGALTWHRLVSKLEGAPREAYAEPVPALLQEFLAGEGPLRGR